MTELTPQYASTMLDLFGVPRHLEPVRSREISIDDARRFLSNRDHRARVWAVARKHHLPIALVRQIWQSLLQRDRP